MLRFRRRLLFLLSNQLFKLVRNAKITEAGRNSGCVFKGLLFIEIVNVKIPAFNIAEQDKF